MKVSYLIYVATLILVAFSSCTTQESEKKDDDSSGELYKEYKHLAEAYCDSLKQASDSAAAGRLLKAFDNHLYALMMKYPPETDAKFSESQNDTLYQITAQIMKYHARAMKQSIDTIVSPSLSDSIPALSPPRKENE